MIPQMIMRQGTHWNARGNRQENELVTGTFEAPYPIQVETIKPIPIICWAIPTIIPSQTSIQAGKPWDLLNTSCLGMRTL